MGDRASAGERVQICCSKPALWFDIHQIYVSVIFRSSTFNDKLSEGHNNKDLPPPTLSLRFSTCACSINQSHGDCRWITGLCRPLLAVNVRTNKTPLYHLLSDSSKEQGPRPLKLIFTHITARSAKRTLI